MSAVLRFVAALAVALLLPAAAMAAATVPSMSLRANVAGQERTALQVGERLQLEVVMHNPGRQPIESVQSWVEYDTSMFRFGSISNDSPFDLAAPGENTAENGVIKIGRGVLSNTPPSGPEFVVVTATLTATAAGNAVFRFSPDHASANIVNADGTVSNILEQVQELTVQVGSGTGGGTLPSGSTGGAGTGGGITVVPDGTATVIDTQPGTGGGTGGGLPNSTIDLGQLGNLPSGSTPYAGGAAAAATAAGPQLVEAVAVNGKLRLVWQRATGVDAYFVFLSPSMDTPWKKVRVESVFNALEVGGLTEGQLYYVAVSSVKNGIESLPGTPRVVLWGPQLKQAYIEPVRPAAPVNTLSQPTEQITTTPLATRPTRLTQTGLGTAALAGSLLAAAASAYVWLRRRSALL